MKITSPEVARDYIKDTGVDSLVVSIGTQSGRLKTEEEIRFEVLEEINKLLPEIPLVLHGGSFMPDAVIKKCIANGIAKINVNSENRIAYTEKLKKNISEKPDEYAPYRLLNGVREEMIAVMKAKIKLFSAGKRRLITD
jgi:fructose-bisphosphate aldolase class II